MNKQKALLKLYKKNGGSPIVTPKPQPDKNRLRGFFCSSRITIPDDEN